MMNSSSFKTGDKFLFKEQRFAVVSRHPGGVVLVESVDTGERTRMLHKDLADAFYSGELEFADGQTLVELPARETHWGDISEEDRRAAEFKYEVIEPLLELSGCSLHEAIIVRSEAYRVRLCRMDDPPVKGSGRTSIYGWLREYRLSGNDKRVLVPKQSNRDTSEAASQFGTEVEEIIERVIQDHEHLASPAGVDMIWRQVKLEISRRNRRRPQHEWLKNPSRMTVYRRIKKHDVDGKVREIRNSSQRVPKQVQQESYTRATVPLEVAEIDHTILDVMVIDDETGQVLGRPTLTMCLDHSTRYPLGYYLGFLRPGYQSVMECLYHTILPKQNVRERFGTENDWIAFGVPSTLVVDNGREFLSRALEDACDQLGILLEISPVGTPQKKGRVERLFRTINTKLVHKLDGTTFSNSQERGDYASQEMATLTLGALHELLHIVIIDIYAQTYHKGLKTSPAKAWEEHIEQGRFFPELGPAPAQLAQILSIPYQRKLQHYGFDLHGVRYWSQELEQLRVRLLADKGDPTITVRQNPADIGQVFIHDPYRKTYITAHSNNRALSGKSLSMYQRLRAIMRDFEGEPDHIAIAKAERELTKRLAKARRSKKLRERNIAARLDETNSTQSAEATRTGRSNHDASRPRKTEDKPRPNFGLVDLDKDRETYRRLKKQFTIDDVDSDRES